MDISKKIVTQIPIAELWTLEKVLEAKRIGYITKEEIQLILKNQSLTFIVADIGQPLKWVDPVDCYSFWKNEVKMNISEGIDYIEYDNGSREYTYLASKWISSWQTPIVVLEKYH